MKYAITWVFILAAATVFLFAWQESAVANIGRSTVEALAWSLFVVWIGMALLGWHLRSREGGNTIMFTSVGFSMFFLVRVVSAY
ncbi:MAG: hypothetical protein WD875_07510 [Pirellulales bacterium]